MTKSIAVFRDWSAHRQDQHKSVFAGTPGIIEHRTQKAVLMYAPPLSCKETAGGDGSLAMPSQHVPKQGVFFSCQVRHGSCCCCTSAYYLHNADRRTFDTCKLHAQGQLICTHAFATTRTLAGTGSDVSRLSGQQQRKVFSSAGKADLQQAIVLLQEVCKALTGSDVTYASFMLKDSLPEPPSQHVFGARRCSSLAMLPARSFCCCGSCAEC